jgi:peptide/nickel transport system ATP-binding protein
MLRGENLSFRYGKNQPWLFQNLNIEVAPGEIVGLSGASGFGKTTLGKILAGYIAPRSGIVTVNGQSLPKRGYSPVQLIFQNPELSVNPRWRIEKILHEGQPPEKELLKALSIHSNWLTRWPHELSGGELQRIAVARSLNSFTRYLIADEMTAMLDANTQALIWQAVTAYTRQHKLGLLVVSHEAALLNRLCGRIIDLSAKNRGFSPILPH